MQITTIHNCLITLEPSKVPYSKKGKKLLLGYKDCSHIIPYKLSEAAMQFKEKLMANQTRISISGVQDKYSMKILKKEFQFTEIAGTYILKPKTSSLFHNEYVPINEHLTMLIANKVFGIETADFGLVLFADGEPAYITKRFDVAKDGTRYLKEDFASVLQRTEMTHGKSYKYDSSYEELAIAIDRFLPSAMIQKEKLFKLAVFNYLISNGDAHLKNFSVISYDMALPYYVLAPAYDLMCTKLHIKDRDFALENRLYKEDYNAESFSKYGYHTYKDFYDFGIRIGLLPVRIKKMLMLFTSNKEMVENYVASSYLNEDLKTQYLNFYYDKLKKLKTDMQN
jgi:serine/threonine-protein kinase HipA